MLRFAPRIYSAESLATLAAAQSSEAGQFPEILNDGCLRDDLRDKWFLTQWGDNTATDQHLLDATIHGPFSTEAEAIAALS